ncbi:MAG: phosphoribosylformylglycinamidine synthase [Flavobacteriales bacterium]|jgi:phosphoribosylformylglycinamidine synthase|uniref:phosphoribosylformylglycinamidine synthase n=1 Tax=Blattabacterium sp. (Mastotermes darwiniensis) TaxID=39768 RepID=UPI000231DDD9|nr:phosphoribosylformylglycinamidine synthase [Blattabacterium sp. (Mastotermes darwiniensis)]AER40525.1 phosphoribosylformylglycinamidine synthase [Blattabacterium sp. (Mastotermes darwiniensis) str. MADAR]MDR1804961.1 phosphoribosylformylglycinamidine synthase [Flavobacteriales bacterium]
MDFRIYIQKRVSFDIYSIKLYQELKDMDISLDQVIVYHIYDIFHIEKKFFTDTLYKVFVDPVTDIYRKKIHLKNPYFAIEYLPGEYDPRADAAMQCLKIMDPLSTVFIKTGRLIELIGLNPNEDIYNIKNYCINPNVYKEKNLKEMEPHFSSSFKKKNGNKKNLKIVEGFIHFTHEELKKIHKEWNFSIDLNDLLFIQQYFYEEENRDPTEAELRILDTYWSDHCRHSTFFTTLVDITFDGKFKETYQNIFNEYLKDRNSIGRSDHPINLMDLSNLPAKILSKKGKLKNYVSSLKERNSCMMKIDVDIIDMDKKKEKEEWYLLFKNETHNHPTEIDPFGGASTCIGGAIRDILSGRGFVYQSIRLSGASDPTTTTKTLNGKLPQRKICCESAYGYSFYGNQVGVATSHIHEIYHEGYRAKKMEVGMVIGAVPVDYVKIKPPKKGDIILLIGGWTGRDGIGGATESSKKYEDKNSNMKKIQKGNPIIERQIQRFFRKKEVISLIKKCNDFGAGGASVAIGELSNSLVLHLDKIPIKKNTYLDPLEIALSESQERMAVVLDPYDVKKFMMLARKENILSVPIAVVTDNERIIFYHKGKKILNLKSSFLNTGGANKKKVVHVNSPTTELSPFQKSKDVNFSKETFLESLSQLNISSQKSMVEMFDSTVGATTILMPFGGKYQITPSEGSVHKIPVYYGETTTVSLASWGFHPDISTWSPLHGGAYAIVECVAKIVAMGGNYKNTYFSFQEYYQKLGNDPKKWGEPFSSLLGAYHAQIAFGLASIGGKDSMSGTYKNIHVPPTLIAFGVTTGSCWNIVSPELKKIGNKIYLYHHKPLKNEMPDFDSLKNAYDKVYKDICSGKIVSVKTVKDGGISVAIAKMSFGNRLGVVIHYNDHFLETHIGSLIIETSDFISSKEFLLIGEVVSSKNLNFNGVSINIEEAIKIWLKTLTPIFNHGIIHKKNILRKKRKKPQSISIWKSNKKVVPRVFIPIFPGTNCEFESIQAFEKEGAIVKNYVFKNSIDKDILIESISQMERYIKSVQIFMLCGGFSAGDEPDGSAKFITSVLHNPYIQESVKYFLDHDGLILGICNGFQGLIKSGLLPYGKIGVRHHKSPTLTYNESGKHISQCVHIKVISDQSPWLKGMKDKVYTVPLSHSEGRFYASENITNILLKKNQIATQYVDLKGHPTLDRRYNPNGSVEAVEGILSEDGKIYGRMTHPERYNYGLLQNIPDINEHSIFKNAVQYFL